MSFSVAGDGFDDPSDFQATAFQDLDEHLRCPICKEFFDTTMILSTCSHSFCALCIRRSLSTEQNCPKCRKAAYENNLIHNYDLDHVVSTWRKSRSFLLSVDKLSSAPPPEPVRDTVNTATVEECPKPIKEAVAARSLPTIIDDDKSDDFVPVTPILKRTLSSSIPATRRSIRLGSQQQPQYTENLPTPNKGKKPAIESSQPQKIEQYETPNYQQHYVPQPDPQPEPESEPLKSTSLVECPICQQKMKYIVLDKHLDGCMKGDSRIPPSPPPIASSSSSSSSTLGSYSGARMTVPLALKTPKPIDLGKKPGKVVYAMLSDKDIRKILKDLGLPDQGDRSQRIWRHKEYINLYNANYDSQTPVSASVLVQRLAAIEQSQLIEKSNQSKRKTPDSDQHKHKYKSEFDLLIEDAKKRRLDKQKNVESTQSNNINDQ